MPVHRSAWLPFSPISIIFQTSFFDGSGSVGLPAREAVLEVFLQNQRKLRFVGQSRRRPAKISEQTTNKNRVAAGHGFNCSNLAVGEAAARGRRPVVAVNVRLIITAGRSYAANGLAICFFSGRSTVHTIHWAAQRPFEWFLFGGKSSAYFGLDCVWSRRGRDCSLAHAGTAADRAHHDDGRWASSARSWAARSGTFSAVVRSSTRRRRAGIGSIVGAFLILLVVGDGLEEPVDGVAS